MVRRMRGCKFEDLAWEQVETCCFPCLCFPKLGFEFVYGGDVFPSKVIPCVTSICLLRQLHWIGRDAGFPSVQKWCRQRCLASWCVVANCPLARLTIGRWCRPRPWSLLPMRNGCMCFVISLALQPASCDAMSWICCWRSFLDSLLELGTNGLVRE